MTEVLESYTAFKSKYVKNPLILKATISCILGIGVSSSIIGATAASFFFFKQKTAYEILDGDWSSDVCSSDLLENSPGVKIRQNGF